MNARILTLAMLMTALMPMGTAQPDGLCVPERVIILGGHCAEVNLAAEDVLVPAPDDNSAIAYLWEIHYKIAGQDADVYLVLPPDASYDCMAMFNFKAGFECSVDSVEPLVYGEITDEGAICSGNAEIIFDDGDDDPDNDYRTDLVPYARLCYPLL